MSIEYRKDLWVSPATIHHFDELNRGRHDPASRGKPEIDIPLLFREKSEEKGEGKPVGWDTTHGVIVAHPIGEVTIPGCTVERALADREKRLAELQVKDKRAAKVYQALYFRDGKPIAPEYMGTVAFRRSYAMPWIIDQWLADDPTRTLSDFLVPVSLRPFVSELDTFTQTLRENDPEKLPYSPVGLLAIVRWLATQGYGESRACTSAGIYKRGAQQKVWQLVQADICWPDSRVIERMSLDPADYSRKIGKDKVELVYSPTGYIPYGPIDWRAIATLRGLRKKSGDWYLPDLAPADGKFATTQEVENYIRSCIVGGKAEVVGMSHVKNWQEMFANLPVTARVGDVLTAITTGNKDFFASLITPAKAPPAEAPPAEAPTHKGKKK